MDWVTRTIVRGGWLVAGALGCGHTQAAQPPVANPIPQSAPAAPPAQDAGVVPSRDAAAAQPPADESEAEPISAFMDEHFSIVAWARNAVIDGDLEAMREPLRSLADYKYESVVPGGWMRGVAQLQAAARLTSEAEDLTRAASGIAAMTRVCGQCHKEQGHSLELEPEGIATKTPKSDSMSARMYRHAWASERLWEGLMAPSDQAWQAGAAALAHAPVRAPKLRSPVPKDFAEALAKLRDLGLRASYAQSPEERSDVYALTLATCADCHADAALALSGGRHESP